MAIKRNQQLIDKIRIELNLPHDLVTDDELWQGTKDSFMAARINLSMAWQKMSPFLLASLACCATTQKLAKTQHRLEKAEKLYGEDLVRHAAKLAEETPYTIFCWIDQLVFFRGKRMKKVDFIRIILTLGLLYGAYTETGPWTTISLFLIMAGFESALYSIKKGKNTETDNGK